MARRCELDPLAFDAWSGLYGRSPAGDPLEEYLDFYGSLQLSGPVDISKAIATYRDGILSVCLPKTAQAKRKQIEIKTD